MSITTRSLLCTLHTHMPQIISVAMQTAIAGRSHSGALRPSPVPSLAAALDSGAAGEDRGRSRAAAPAARHPGRSGHERVDTRGPCVVGGAGAGVDRPRLCQGLGLLSMGDFIVFEEHRLVGDERLAGSIHIEGGLEKAVLTSCLLLYVPFVAGSALEAVSYRCYVCVMRPGVR